MIKINDKSIEESLAQLKKAIEVIGGNKYISEKDNVEEQIIKEILLAQFNGKEGTICINEKDYAIKDLLPIKLDYEKNFLKNKGKVVQAIVYKVKKYDTSLDSIIRKYRKTKGIEEYREICNEIQKRYSRDIDAIVLSKVDNNYLQKLNRQEMEVFYGEYLLQKRKAIIDSVISKMGIV